MISSRKQLLDEIEAFLVRTGMTPTAFAVHAGIKDREFVARLRAGFDLLTSNMDKARAFMAGYQHTPRPKRRGGAARITAAA